MTAPFAIPPPDPRFPLRSGGIVETYAAEFPEGRDVVVKRLVPERAVSDPLGAKRFARELHLAAVLRHPSLPRLLAVGQDWMALEYLDAPLTDPSVRERITDTGGGAELLRELAGALAYVHAQGVIHRDIKPGHVMFRQDVPVLIDFGIAGLRFGDPLAGSEFSGSPAWMAPEQMAGDPGGPEADVWALCALGLWLLTGTRPYSGPPQEILARRRSGEPPRFDMARAEVSAPPQIVKLLREGLGEAGSRPASAEIARLLDVRRSPVRAPDAVS